MKKKKQKRKIYNSNASTEYEYTKIIRIVVIVSLFLGLTYFLTALITGEIKLGNKKKDTETEEVAIQYEEIIAGQVLSRSDEEYYVMALNFTDTFASYFISLKDKYVEAEDDVSFYILDLEKAFNTDIVLKDDENYEDKPSNISDLKVENPTILKIKNGKVVKRITGRDKILDFFDTED